MKTLCKKIVQGMEKLQGPLNGARLIGPVEEWGTFLIK